jgi:transposase InsO family protein
MSAEEGGARVAAETVVVASAGKPPVLLDSLENYDHWANVFQGYAFLNGISDVIKQAPVATNAAQVTADKKLRGALIMAVQDTHLLDEVTACATGKDAYKLINDRYEVNLNAITDKLESQWRALRKGADESVAQYISRALNLAKRRRKVGYTYTDQQVNLAILKGLPQDYMAVAINLRRDAAAMRDTQGLLSTLMDTEQLLLEAADNASNAVASTLYAAAGRGRGRGRGGGSRGRGGRGGAGGGRGSSCGAADIAPAVKGKCFKCGETGHWKRDCPVKRGQQQQGAVPHQQGSQYGSSSSSALAFTVLEEDPAVLAMHRQIEQWGGEEDARDIERLKADWSRRVIEGLVPHQWVVDSGAQRHIVSDPEALHNARPADVAHVQYGGNGQQGQVTAMGDLHVVVPNSSSSIGSTEFVLRDVLCVPEVVCNIISVPCLAKAGGRVIMDGTGAQLVAPSGEVFAEAHMLRKMYLLRGEAVLPQKHGCAESVLAVTAVQQAQEWRRRMGHASYEACATLPQLATGCDVPAAAFKEAAGQSCEVCMQGKATRLPFPSAAEHSRAEPLGRLHCDVLYVRPAEVGLFLRQDVAYVSTVLDEGTGISSVALLTSKDQAAEHVRRTVEALERQSSGGHKVKAIRSDRGGEYMGRALQGWCADRGIKWEPTAPYSPQQNGRAERLNRTLLERTRCMLIDSSMPQRCWPEALKHANWLRNRLVYTPLGMSPLEALTGRKPDLSRVRGAFGSRLVYMVPQQQRISKLDPTGRIGRFMGFDGGACMVLPDSPQPGVPGQQRLVLSRDVRFIMDPAAGEAGSAAADEGMSVVYGSSGSTAIVGEQQQQGIAAQAGNSAGGSSTQQQGAAVGQQQNAGSSGASGSGAAAGGAGSLSPAVRLPVQRLGAAHVVPAAPPGGPVEGQAEAEVPAQQGRVTRSGRVSTSSKYDPQQYALHCGTAGGDPGAGSSSADPLSAFVSFR